ncbi:MAG: hypothetical protein WAL56_16000, partial [Candidatus Sulfotelmatobacter sp.]
MKLPMLSLAVACLPFISAPSGVCQQQNPQPERPIDKLDSLDTIALWEEAQPPGEAIIGIAPGLGFRRVPKGQECAFRHGQMKNVWCPRFEAQIANSCDDIETY